MFNKAKQQRHEKLLGTSANIIGQLAAAEYDPKRLHRIGGALSRDPGGIEITLSSAREGDQLVTALVNTGWVAEGEAPITKRVVDPEGLAVFGHLAVNVARGMEPSIVEMERYLREQGDRLFTQPQA